MKENMRAKHYADGSSISYYAYSSSDIPLEQRGYFYTWSAVMNGASSSDTTPSGVQGICPTGWHVPSKGEWTEFSQYVGSQSQYLCGNNSNYIAKALASTQRWYSCTNTCAVGNVPSINTTTGFSAVPVGYHGSSYNDYNESGYCAYFWSSTEYSFSGAYARRIGRSCSNERAPSIPFSRKRQSVNCQCSHCRKCSSATREGRCAKRNPVRARAGSGSLHLRGRRCLHANAPSSPNSSEKPSVSSIV